jgi:hypothetical protein
LIFQSVRDASGAQAKDDGGETPPLLLREMLDAMREAIPVPDLSGIAEETVEYLFRSSRRQ